MQPIYNRRIFKAILLMGTIIFCSNTGCKNQQPGKHEILLYYRDVGDNNHYKTFMDNLAITEYKNKSLTIKQFADIAKSYVDTATGEMPVSSVTFIGQKPGGTLPEGDWSTSDEQKKYLIISIGFDNGFAQNANKKYKEVDYIAIWHDKKATSYIQQSEIDSLLNVKELLDTGF